MAQQAAGHLIPRRYLRYPVPSTLHVVAEFNLPPNLVHLGRLRDISVIGACLALSGRQRIPTHSEGLVVIHSPESLGQLSMLAQVRWSAPTNDLTLLGVEFTEGQLAEGTFLDTFITGTWVNGQQEVLEESY
ncbi:MAG: PilZ domain-containing protein [Prochlorococcaceae cyanobacterium]